MASQPTNEVRRICAQRQGGRCARCGISLAGIPASLHHRLMRSHGAGYDDLHKPSNLIWLCGSGTTGCHGHVHANPAEAYEMGWLVHWWDDPHKMPCMIYGIHGDHGFKILDDAGGLKPAPKD